MELSKCFLAVSMAVVVVLGTVVVRPAAATTIYVTPDGNGDAPTIQAGLGACAEGDTVLVAAGIFYENLYWPQINGIVLVSESGREETVIDGSNQGSVVTVEAPVDETTRIEGLTITGGVASHGGGIRVNYGSPTIRGNSITDNTASYHGGGISVDGTTPAILENEISFNHAGTYGGGIGLYASSALVKKNSIKQNTVSGGNTGGGGIAIGNSSPTVCFNTIVQNDGGGSGGGIGVYEASAPRVFANRIEDNIGYAGGGLIVHYSEGQYYLNIINNNTANNVGGGVILWKGKAELRHNDISYNIALQGNCGGGIMCVSADSSVIDYCTITDNTVYFGMGGGVQCQANTAPVISNSTIANNTGWGIYCRYSAAPNMGGNPLIVGCNIFENELGGVGNNDDRFTVDARENWWGAANGPGGEGPGDGDAISLYVQYEPWATESHLLPTDVEPQKTPSLVTLAQNYPNPFNPRTAISFNLGASMRACVEVYDLSGRRVKVLAEQIFAAGRHELSWNGCDSRGRGMPAGVYFIRLVTESNVETRKAVLVR